MRNPDLPKLLKSIAGTQPQNLKVIYEQAAIELEKLEKIYKLVEQGSASEPCETLLKEILNAN